jgi:hypothetical protein
MARFNTFLHSACITNGKFNPFRKENDVPNGLKSLMRGSDDTK